jgi:putative transposase
VAKNRYRTAAHSRYTIYYHLVILPKYRRDIFKHQELEDATKESLRELAYHHEWIVEELEADQDHIHIFLSAPPRYSPSDIVKLIKSWTYYHVYRKYPKIKQYLWGGKMWAVGFYVSTVSDNTTKDEIARYVRNQKEQAKKQSMAQKLF